jgi:hypothetical protein
LKRCLYYLAILLFGDDVRFMQFGTCLRYVGPFDKS